MNSDMMAARLAVESAERDRVAASNAAKEAEVKTLEFGGRAEDLRTDLGHARSETAKARAEMTATRVAHTEQMEHLRDQAKRDLSDERERVGHDKQRIQEALSLAQQEAAELRGWLAATRTTPTPTKRTETPNGDATKQDKGA